jgi:TonB family protein
MLIAALLLTSAVPTGNPGNWITTDDYPAAPMEEGVEGTTEIALDVLPDGKPKGCKVVTSSGNADLDEASCRLLVARARFQPSKIGEPQSFTTRIKWDLPDPVLTSLAPQGFSAFMPLKNGAISGECVQKAIGQPSEKIPLCDFIPSDGSVEKLGMGDLAGYSELIVRIAVGREGDIKSSRLEQKHRQLVSASFTLNASGLVEDCAVTINEVGADFGSFCSSFNPKKPEFDVSSANSFPVQMLFTFDVQAR